MKRILPLTLLLLGTLASAPVMAGFQFTSPKGIPAGPTDPVGNAPAVPPAAVAREELALPMPGENLGDLRPQGTAPSALKGPEMTPGMKTLGSAPAAPSKNTAGQPIAAGFGRDVPLAIAVQQILPKGMVPAPAEGIDMGTKVTWEGGKPWQQVLDSTLAPMGLTSRIDGQQVRIEHNQPPQFPTPDNPMPEHRDVAGEMLPMPGENTGTDGMDQLPAADMNAGMDTGEPIDLGAPPEQFDQGQSPIEMAANDIPPSQPRRMPPAAAPQQMPPPAAPMSSLEDDLMMPPPATMQSGPMSHPGDPVAMPAPAAPAAPAADIGRVADFTALAGQDLRTVLDAWSTRVGVKVVWDNPHQYAVPETHSATQPYQQAVTDLLESYQGTGAMPRAKLYAGGNGDPAVLMIN